MADFPLQGLHVLDFSWVGAGPITTKYLADYGADVVRIESATHIDILRLAPPWKDGQPGINRSQFFASYNTSKKSLALNLGHFEGREIARRLVAWADVMVENFTPGMMARWELDYPRLQALRPGIIMLSTCMQGQSGPRAAMPGFGQLMAALSGFYYLSGYPGGDPTPPYGAYTDFIVPRFAACILLAALDYRRRTGAGQFIDLSQFEAGLHFLAPMMVDYFASGRVWERQGNHSQRFAPHGAYRCRDEGGLERWISLAVVDDEQWRILLEVLAAGPGEARLATLAGRLADLEALDQFMADQFRTLEAWEITQRLQAAGIAAYPVQSCLDLHQDENLAAFGFWHRLEHRTMGASPYEGLQHRLERTPGELRWAAPELGQHSDEILNGILGLSVEEIARLRRDGVLT